MHEVYIEEVAKILKPRKAWQDQIKILVAVKAPVETKSYIPKSVSASDYHERGFYPDNNCYFFMGKKGEPLQRSNFIMTPLFHVESTINAKRLYELTNVKGLTRVIEIPQKDMVTISAFKIRIESLGNFLWTGSDADMNRLKSWLYDATETCKEVDQMGWHKDGFYVWGNGIYNSEFVPVDKYGIVRHNNSNYYIPAFSSIFDQEDKLYQFERKFVHMEGNITLKEYTKKFVKVFGENGKIAMCFYFASLFRDIVVNRFDKFPLLNLFGPKGAGKNACAETLAWFFGQFASAPNINNTSKPALADHVATTCNALCIIDELRNDLEMEKREYVKGLWDGTGRTRMNMDKDKKKETTPVDQGVIICGQQMATADIALFSRFIFLGFTQTEYSEEEKAMFDELKVIRKRGLTHITNQLLSLRSVFKDNYHAHAKKVAEAMQVELAGKVIEDRIFNNWLCVIAAYSTLEEHIELPWEYNDLIKLSVRLMVGQNKEIKTNDDLGHFWKTFEYLASSNLIYNEGDFKIAYRKSAKRMYYEDGQWKVSLQEWGQPKELLYLTVTRPFSQYKMQTLREGDKPLPAETVEYYLKNSKAFLFETKKESFKKIDPKTGAQEVYGEGEKIVKRRTSTTALVFDLGMLNINLSKDEQLSIEINTPEPEAEAKQNDEEQGDLPF
jgi:hypothetical protein